MKTSFSAIIATNRAEIVEQLRSLADALEGDEPVEMDLNGMELEFDLPEDAECGFELELDSEGECELEVEINWNAKLKGSAQPTADEAEEAEEEDDDVSAPKQDQGADEQNTSDPASAESDSAN